MEIPGLARALSPAPGRQRRPLILGGRPPAGGKKWTDPLLSFTATMLSLPSFREFCLSRLAVLAAAGGADATEDSRRTVAQTA